MSVDSRYQLGRSIPLRRHDLSYHRGQTACHVSGSALGVLRSYVPRGRRRWSGRGSVLSLNSRFRYETKRRLASLESSFRLVVAPQRKGTRVPSNTVEMQDSSRSLAFCALLCIAARLRGARGPVLADSGDSRSSRGGASSRGSMRSSVARRRSLRRAYSPRTTSEVRRVSMAVSRR